MLQGCHDKITQVGITATESLGRSSDVFVVTNNYSSYVLTDDLVAYRNHSLGVWVTLVKSNAINCLDYVPTFVRIGLMGRQRRMFLSFFV